MSEKTVIQKMAGTGMLFALEIVLQLIGNYVNIGPVNINLSLMPIVMGAVFFGPLSGLFLGLANGVVTILAPGTSAFLAVNAFWTIVICLAKTGLAGLASGFIYKAFEKRHLIVGIVLASIIVPIINSGIFALGCLTVLRNWLISISGESNQVYVLFILVIGVNFLFELGVELLFTPALIYVFKIVTKRLGNKKQPTKEIDSNQPLETETKNE